MDLEYSLNDIKQALDAGDNEKVLGMFRSIEGAVEDCKQKMQETEQLRMEFLATISHELRTPLNAIIGFNSLLEDGIYGELNEKQRRAVQRVDRNSTRLLTLVNQLLDLSRLEAGAVSVFYEKSDMNHAISEILDDYKPTADEKGLIFEVTQPHGGLPLVTDAAKVREIVRQLVSNAIKFTSNGTIKITAKQVEGGALIEIADTGPGIPEDKREAVFDLFRQCDSSYTRKHEGAGLGLAIVNRLACLLDIKTEIQSEAGQGLVFRLTIPCNEQSSQIEEKPADAELPSHIASNEPAVLPVKSQAKNVLIVDDDPYTVEILAEFLETRGHFRVEKAFSGMHAMIHLAKQKPDYLLVDLLMPQINGERVIQYCHELWGKDQVKIIIITGKTLDQHELYRLENLTHAIVKKGDLRPQTLSKTLEPVIQLSAKATA